MKKIVRTIACIGLTAALVQNVTAVEERYVSIAGDDSADGKTPQTAWRTLEKVCAGLPAGATVRLKCGDVFYGHVRLPNGLDEAHPTALTSWGDGPKPVISETKNLTSDPLAWEDLTHCFWRIDLRNPTNSTGVVTDDCNPGFLLVDGEVKPWKRYCHDDLVSLWDFCGEDGWLYVHADKNPALLAKDIRVALRIHAVQFGSHCVISNIAVRATGAHGMHGGWGCDLRHVRISDCELENIGGSELPNFSPKFRIRYGNGIELGGDAQDVIVERCSFKGVYDVAFTMQGFPKKGWKDVHVRNCTMTDCTQAFEIWCKGASKGVGFERCSFTGNRTLRVGGGWGERVRPMRACATPLLMYRMETDTVDIEVSGNRFEDVSHGLFFWSGHDKDGPLTDRYPAGYRVHDNVVVTNQNRVKVSIETSLGEIALELDAAKAPLTVSNFVQYARSGHYDGTVFHRVINGFMIQGGGFTPQMEQKETRAPIRNEAANGLRNKRGTIAMARTMVIDSATSEFFINLKDNAFLDHTAPNPRQFGYAVFGHVTKGMDVVDKIAQVKTGTVGYFQDVPVVPVVIKSVKIAE